MNKYIGSPKITILFFKLILCIAHNVQGQFNLNLRNKTEAPIVDFTDFKKHVAFLNNPSLEFRVLNSKGNFEAVQYLSSRLKEMGLKDIGNHYKYSFNIPTGQVISYESMMTINNLLIKVPKDGYPLAFSDTTKVSNSILGLENSFHNIWILPAYSNAQESKLSDVEMEKVLHKKAANAAERGAIGVIFYNNMGEDFVLPFKDNTALPKLSIPVYELGASVVKERIQKQRRLTNIMMHAIMKPVHTVVHNVVGYIDNQAKETIIISSNIDGEKSDNYHSFQKSASGMATVLMLANELSKKKTNFNYIVAFYNGTANNLIGSEKWLNDPISKNKKVIAALHYTDVGLMDESKMSRVSGVGTYAGWRQYFANKNSVYGYFLENKGAIISDFQNYYKLKIPYLAFASNNYEGNLNLNKTVIDYEGLTQIILKSREILEGLGSFRTLPVFNETEDVPVYTVSNTKATNTEMSTVRSTERTTTRTTKAQQLMQNPVSLGVLPDLGNKEAGVLVGQVNKNTPAEKGGLLVGDIIVQIRNFPVQHYDDYLAALNNFKKGDKTYIKLKRRGAIIQKLITF